MEVISPFFQTHPLLLLPTRAHFPFSVRYPPIPISDQLQSEIEILLRAEKEAHPSPIMGNKVVETMWPVSRLLGSPLKSRALDEHELMQKKTFTKWINYHLDQHSSSGRVHDLYEDLRDGLLLCHLIEVLTGDALQVNKARVPKRIHHISNLTTALSALRRRGLDLINNNPADIADGNPRIILGLIWQIILHFQVETNLRLLSQHSWPALSEPITSGSTITSHEISTEPGHAIPSTSRHTSIPGWIHRGLHLRSSKSPSPAAQQPESSQSGLGNTSILSKASIERMLLKWLNDEISRNYNIPINDFDQSWRDGIAFCALVHRFWPPLINMDIVRSPTTTPRQNLEMAFEIARLHLNIRPLLDVDDMLRDRPDKRSVITYISQFIRISHPVGTSRPLHAQPPSETAIVSTSVHSYQTALHRLSEELALYRPLVDWLDGIAKDRRIQTSLEEEDKERQDTNVDDYKWYVKVRKEFLEKRMIFKEILEYIPVAKKEHKKQLNEIEKEWKHVADSLHQWSEKLQKEFPPSFYSIAKWVDDGEFLIQTRTPVVIDPKNIDESLQNIENTIEIFEAMFNQYPQQRETFYTALQDFHEARSHLDGQSQSTDEILEILRSRFESLSEKFRMELKRLLLYQAYYRILRFQAELKTKMRLWQNATSLSLTKRWLNEYQKTANENPEIRMEKLLLCLQNAVDKEPGELQNRGQLIYTEMEKECRSILSRFSGLASKLAQLREHWADFDESAAKAIAHGERALELEDRIQHLAKCTILADSIEKAQTSPAVGNAAKTRLAQIRQQFDSRSKKEEITAKDQITAVQRQIPTRKVEITIDKAIEGTVSTKCVQWMQSAAALNEKKADSVKSATDIIQQLTDIGKDYAAVELDLQKSLQQNGHSEQQKQQQEEFTRQIHECHQRIRNRLDAFKLVYHTLCSAEKNLLEMEKWVTFHDPDSEMAKKSIKERSEIVDQIKLMLDNLETPANQELLDTTKLKEIYVVVSSCFALVEIRRIEVSVEVIETRILVRRRPAPTATQQPGVPAEEPEDSLISDVLESLDQVHARDPESVKRITSLRQKIHTQRQTKVEHQAGVSLPAPVDRVHELLERKAVVLARQEQSEESAKTSIVEMDMLNEAIQLHKGKSNTEYQRLEAEWRKKLAGLDRLLLMIGEIKKLEKTIEEAGQKLPSTKREVLKSNLESIGRALDSENRLNVPLMDATRLRLRNTLKKLEQSFLDEHKRKQEAIKQRLGAFEMTSEDDLRIGLDIVKEIKEEARELHLVEQSYAEVFERAQRLESNLAQKMDFFNRLQTFHDNVKKIRQQNAEWNAITSSEIDTVLSALEEERSLISEELNQEMQILEVEIASLEGSFFQLEHDRVREKFRLLTEQLSQMTALIDHRKEFLTRLKEFYAYIKKCKNTILAASQTLRTNPEEVQRMTVELSDLQTKLHDIAKAVCMAQHSAEMNVIDLSIEDAIKELEEIAVPTPNTLTNMEMIVIQTERLRASLASPIVEFDATHMMDISNYILNILTQIESDKAQMEEIDRLVSLPKSGDHPDILQVIDSLRISVATRRCELDQTIDTAVANCINMLRQSLSSVESNLISAMEKNSLAEVSSIEENALKQCTTKIGVVEKAVGQHQPLAERKAKWTSNFGELEMTAFNIEAKIKKFTASLAKNARREQRLLKNLSAFEKWLDLVEKDIANVSNSAELDIHERQAKLIELRENCTSHSKLVEKLEVFEFEDKRQKEIAVRSCERYRQLMDKLNSLNLPTAKLVPIHIETCNLASSSAIISQHSLASSSTITDESEDLDSDLASVQSEVSRAEAIQWSKENVLKRAKSISEMFQHVSTSMGELDLARIEGEINSVVSNIHQIQNHYSMPPLKSLHEAEEDIKNLKIYVKELDLLKEETKKLAENGNYKQSRQLQKLIKMLKKEKNSAKKFHENLLSEIEDETTLQVNYQQLMSNLANLESEVLSASEHSRAPNTQECLAKVELEIELLKKQCRRSRKYIEMSVDGSRSSSPTRKFKVILRITNNVTTIIQIIEDELRRQMSKKAQRRKPESESELKKLHRTLSHLKDSTKEEFEPEISTSQTEREMHTMEHLEADLDIAETSGISSHEVMEPMLAPVEYEMARDLLAFVRRSIQVDVAQEHTAERLAGLLKKCKNQTQKLKQLEQQDVQLQTTGADSSDAREAVSELVRGLELAEVEITEKCNQVQRRQNLIETLSRAIDMEQKVVSDPSVSIVQMKQSIERCNAVLHEAELLESELPSTSQNVEISAGIGQLKRIQSQLSNEYQQAENVNNIVQEAQRLLIKLDDIVKNQPRPSGALPLESAIDEFREIEAKQNLAERLSENRNTLINIGISLPILEHINESLRKYHELKDEYNRELEKEKAYSHNLAEFQKKINHKSFSNNHESLIEELRLIEKSEMPQRKYVQHDIDAVKEMLDQAHQKLSKECARQLEIKIATIREQIDKLESSAETNPEQAKKKKKRKKGLVVTLEPNRDDIIMDTRRNLKQIEEGILPIVKATYEEMVQANVNVEPIQREHGRTVEMIQRLQSELAAKEQEKTNVEGVLHAAQELEELTSGQPHAEMPNMEATNEDLARKQIDALQADIQKINEALERLDKEPTSASMTKDEEDTLRKSKEHARAHLKQLVENCSDLQRHIDLLGELHKRNDTLAEKVLADGQALSTLQQKYQTGSVPQSLIAAEDDLRRAESIRSQLDEANEQLLSLQKWVGTALPQSKEASDLTKSIEETLNNCRSELDNLTQPLQEGVDLGKKIQSEKNSVSQKLSEMVSKAKDIHSISDPSQRSAELSALQQQIDPLHTQLQQLEQQLAHTEPAYVLPIEGSELDILGKSMEELKSLLSSEAEDAAKKLANAQTAAGLREISNRLRENIERAERIDIDSNAKREDLLSAMHLLEESKAELEEMQRIAESLDPTDEQANEVRNKAANEQAELGEQLLILRQSLDDRTDTLKKFDEELAKAEEDLDKLARMLAEPKESTSVEYIENILKKSDELFPSAILTLKNLAEAAKPIVEPRRKVDALLQRQADFIANAKAAEKQAEENEKRIAYTQKLAALEEELKAIEHALQTSIQLKTAETLRGFNNDSVRPLFDKFEALEEAPNEELKEQRQKLKAASIKLKNNADEKEKQVVQQENLIRDIDAQISQHEAALAAILARYENAQPASKVEEDIHELEKIKDSALMLPLDEITEKATREQFSNRIEPVRAEVNEVLQSLIEELDNVRRIQTTYDNVAEKLLSTESNMTATTQETPEKILSKSAEIGEVLPVLRQELETMAQSLTKPMKFVEIPQQVQPSHLENKLNEVATSNANMVKKAVTDQKVALLAPQIEALTASLQSTVNEVKNAPPASLDQQESTLRMLEAEKQKITTLLESIPEDAKEAETIKEKSTWELGRLADLIKRLGETVGEKVAALSSFFAAKAEVESQLAEIGRQLEEQQKGEDASAEPNISALAEQQQKVEKLREKLRVEIAADSLDQERSAEFDQLMSSLELMLVKIANAREAAERQIALKKVADLQKSKVNRANNELVSLIEQAFRLLNDAAAIPQSYEDLALKIAEVLNAAEQLAQEDPSAETLQSNIAEAHSAKQRLDDRWATWLKFVEERKSANTFLDAARKPLDIVEKKALRNMDEAQQDLADLIDGQGALVQLNETLEKLQTFAEQLDPLETSYADVRFLDVDYEQSEKQYEPIMSDLRSEIDQENQLLESTKHLEAELIHMRNTVSQLENLDELTNQSDSIIPEMTSALDNLKQQNALASKERRMVNPTSGLAKNAELLDELKAYLTQRIATLTEKQQQLEIEEIRSELHQIQQNPSDSQIENIESKFNQLKFSNVSTEELKQELANIKHERAEKQRLEKELGDKLRMITQELGQILLIHPLLASQVSEKTKKRKKKDTAKVATTADRSSQIAELRKSAELIETKLLPSLNQLQADIANAGLTTIATQKEVEHAAKLLDNIKSELAAKEQEKTNVEGVLHAAQELEELTSGQPHAEMPNMEATNEDLARKQIDALQADIQKINEALERLDKEPTSASMTKDEEDTLRKSKEHARAHLKQLVENCSDLQRHIDLLGELHKRNDTLAEKVLADGQALSTLQQKYQTGSVPQSLIAAEDDLRRAESIRFELDEANERLLSLQKWVGTALPQSKEASDLTKSIEETLNNCRSELDNLTQPLQEGVDLGKKIQSEKNSVSQKLSEMVSKAKDIHSISDPSQRSAELSALQQQIDPLHTQLQQLEQQLAHTEPAYVLPIEGSELDILGKSMEELKSLLSSEAEDAAKKLANAQTAAGLREISNRLRENIERAERIDIDSNAKREDLLSAMHLLEESKAELEEMQRIAESLDPTDEQANEVRNKAANEQAELGEQLLILRQSLDDRTDTLKKFDEELAKAEEDLDKLARMLAEPKESTSVEYIENILKKSDELFPSAILTLKNLAEAAKPIVEPRRKVDALLQRQADFIANAKAAEKQAEENEKRIAYTQKLAALEEELKAIEHALQTSIQLKTAETLRGFNNDSVRPLFDKFEALEEAPNEELKEQRQKLKAASIKLKNNADEKEKQVVQQENLIRDIDAQISQHEAALAAILLVMKMHNQPQKSKRIYMS
ncbi:calponin homology (CH) domain-containing protein [Ditylenchus destructor]|nr:calponin homology (CH) domain-containing protein [Ditylenchus destructor]